MIVVIADDLTGAAELSGIGLRYHLKTEVTTDIEALSEAELLIIALDTRSKQQHEAELDIAKASRLLAMLKPRFVFKKIDSVLRGHVLSEIKVQMDIMGQQRALIVSANPSLDRTIVDGIYLFKGQPIHLSSFAHDPEFPIASSRVTDMLHPKDDSVHVLKTDEPLQEKGIMVGEVQSGSDLATWAEKLTPDTMAVGASGFFEAILKQLNFTLPVQGSNAIAFQQPSLFVCGTTFQKSRDAIKKQKESGGPVSYMPEEIISSHQPTEELFTEWAKEIMALLLQHRSAVIAIDPLLTGGASAYELRECTAITVAKVLQKAEVHELFLEGGSTAAAILRKCGITNFHPVEQLAPGVIRMQANSRQDLFFTLKPGSYDWPGNIPI